MKNFKETKELVLLWAEPKGLLTHEIIFQQLTKGGEEYGEIAAGLCRNDLEKIKDSIGDMVVVLTILCHQNSVNIEDCLSYKLDQPTESNNGFLTFAKITSAFGRVAESCLDNNPTFLKHYVALTLIELTHLSKMYELTLEECFDYAYNNIANRKGKKIDGVFVKEEDLEEDMPCHCVTDCKNMEGEGITCKMKS